MTSDLDALEEIAGEHSRLRSMLRRASNAAVERYGRNGLPKVKGKPKPISLPRLKCLEGKE